jgi:nucleotide-binding universal stress UspA family protein
MPGSFSGRGSDPAIQAANRARAVALASDAAVEMEARGRTGVDRDLLGSTTGRLVRHPDQHMLAVHEAPVDRGGE